MAPKFRGKRVRIQSGHQARYIENRRNKKKSKSQQRKKQINRARLSKVDEPGGRQHRSTISELVYQFLEKASRRGNDRRRKQNATSQFRRLQRHQRSRGRRPVKRIPHSFNACNNADDNLKQGKSCIEKCIIDVLSFGTIMGFLKPVDKKGMIFRVASDLNLFDKKNKERRKNVENIIDDDDSRSECIC